MRPGELFSANDPALGQLGRLSDGFGCRLRPQVPLHGLTIAVARDLRAAGFELHDCLLGTETGGVCLLPSSADDGVVVTWAEHDVLARGSALDHVYGSVLETVNGALATVLACMGWYLEPLGLANAYVARPIPLSADAGRRA